MKESDIGIKCRLTHAIVLRCYFVLYFVSLRSIKIKRSTTEKLTCPRRVNLDIEISPSVEFL